MFYSFLSRCSEVSVLERGSYFSGFTVYIPSSFTFLGKILDKMFISP